MITINASYPMAMWADVHYFCDPKFWNWHKDDSDWDQIEGQRITLEQGRKAVTPYPTLRNGGTEGFDERPDHIRTGRNSGYQAVHLAAHFGARRIVLLGFDMKAAADGRIHWHKEHPSPTREGTIGAAWMQHWPALAPELKKRGIEVINCTRDTALRVFPVKHLEDVL